MLDPEDEGNTFFRNAETTHPTIRHIPKDLSPQQHCSENHKSCKYSFLLLSASKVHNLFQSEFSTECDLVPLLSVSSDNPAAAYVFLLVFRSVAETGGRGGVEGCSNYRDPGPDHVAYVFVFLCSIIICRLYKLILSDKAQVTLQLKVSLSDLV